MKSMCCVLAGLLCLAFTLLEMDLNAQTNVVAQSNDLPRTGWNKNEAVSDTLNVRPGSFGNLPTRAMDDRQYAQLLITPNVAIPGNGQRNVVFSTTEINTVYGHNEDSMNFATPYRQVNLVAAGMLPLQNTDKAGASDGNYSDFIMFEPGSVNLIPNDPIIKTVSIIALMVIMTAGLIWEYLNRAHAKKV